jgi:hypothetical protein
VFAIPIPIVAMATNATIAIFRNFFSLLSAPYTSLSNPSRDEYKRIFAYYYVEELRQNYSSGRMDIRKNVGNDLYFILTFKDSPYAYFLTKAGSEISHDKMDVFYYSIDGLSLALPPICF